MAIDHTIPLMSKGIDGLEMYKNSALIGDLMSKQNTESELNRLYTQAGGDTSKMMELAKGSKLFALVAPQIQKQQTAKAQAALEGQKTQSEIYKNMGSGAKEYANAGKTTQEAGQNRYSSAQPVFETLALSGSVDGGLNTLNNLKATGAIDDDTYNRIGNQLSSLHGQNPEDIKRYGFMTAKSNLDPKYNYNTADKMLESQTSIANNTANNEQSNINNQRTTNASVYSTDVNAKTQQAKLNQDQNQFDQNMRFNNQKEFFSQNKPVGFDVDANGRKYALLANGKAVYVTDDTGQQVKNQLKNGSNSQAEEKTRMDRIDAILPEIEKILPNATHSYLGKGLDIAGNAFGASTKGQQASAQLKTLGGQLVSLMPKMSGPQSDKDVAMYKEMAGNLSDDTIPIKTRLAALQSIRDLNNKYRSMSEPQAQKPQQNSPSNTQLQNILFGS